MKTTTKLRKAQKDHDCEMCEFKILKTERYMDEKSISRKGGMVRKFHLKCHEIMMLQYLPTEAIPENTSATS